MKRAQSLVDLPVLAVAPLLHRLHDEQANRDANDGNNRDAGETEEHGLPGTEVEITHELTFILIPRALQSQPLGRLDPNAGKAFSISIPAVASWLLFKISRSLCSNSDTN